ncbi:type II toxin-antitoxin system VapC family toxin [Anabaena cylindrica FACHB-243]|uniref:PilT protein domain protein n=1 Tax=Anabaena cylindrica (strain ATCC 27899 / PCC 7122) TaxID=272123 RepID=K9ZEB8_ANACC|nr:MULTISPECIES: type II toxin-antitoxin system VapC family toxin [Anabaena]AFZ57558.1 PilT protein domain protein [Anabaena cylindrica PCC 7122]MBD2418495.1 type II toxin-antitoxin system VapC family toxin [Anabaena cylindrica FACHB-243]MBY5283706.1 type II toxin-antitoxin system VapC family toxin [Anabaena sp. CCAP 1446/1C]MBY5308482.1 type II toxin-antitoxin system VapC family toxin [Anabaena sp. CCAP 1446/1C]MCM2405077.1 type II toxin-antitoxin system VapC family toxin [Anabaena sp. CCAP 1
MGYLLDTCVVSDFVKGEESTLKKLKSISPVDIFISSLTVMELKYGLAINPQRAVKIQPLIETFLNSITILTFGSKEAEQSAEIRSILKISGSPIGAYDVLIAATAITHNHIVVTSNVREFQRVPNLQIENWRSVS